MKRSSLLLVVMVIFLAGSIAGCQTAPKKMTEEMSGIKARVDTLESKVDSMESRQSDSTRPMTEYQGDDEAAVSRARSNIGIKERQVAGRDHNKQIQESLKAGGFYAGKVDGVMGKKTKRAIKAFQKANGLTPDGVVGKKTWDALVQGGSSAGR